MGLETFVSDLACLSESGRAYVLGFASGLTYESARAKEATNERETDSTPAAGEQPEREEWHSKV